MNWSCTGYEWNESKNALPGSWKVTTAERGSVCVCPQIAREQENKTMYGIDHTIRFLKTVMDSTNLTPASGWRAASSIWSEKQEGPQTAVFPTDLHSNSQSASHWHFSCTPVSHTYDTNVPINAHKCAGVFKRGWCVNIWGIGLLISSFHGKGLKKWHLEREVDLLSCKWKARLF